MPGFCGESCSLWGWILSSSSSRSLALTTCRTEGWHFRGTCGREPTRFAGGKWPPEGSNPQDKPGQITGRQLLGAWKMPAATFQGYLDATRSPST